MDSVKRIAIVHDSIRYVGGAERVLLALHRMFPGADVYTSSVYWEDLGKFRQTIKTLKPRTSFVQRFRLFRRFPFLYRYLLPFIWRSFDFSSYQLVISSSHAQMSHLIRVSRGTVHICYCHSPPRHLYGYATDYPWRVNVLLRIIASIGNMFLRFVDRIAAQRVDAYISPSREVADRIQRIYGRASAVIYPPVSLTIKRSAGRKHGELSGSPFYLVVSRLSRMKHIDTIVDACKQISARLYIVGVGPEQRKLQTMADDRIVLVGQVDDKSLAEYYAACSAVICAAEDEDFGIVPAEAMSFGKPVVAYRSGGYKETVLDGKTGVFFGELSAGGIVKALLKLKSLSVNPRECKEHAQNFSISRFEKNIRIAIHHTMKEACR